MNKRKERREKKDEIEKQQTDQTRADGGETFAK